MTRRSSIACLVAIGVAISTTGCGGGSGDRTVSVSSIAATEFAKRVEAICAHGRLRGLRYRASAGGQSEERALAEAIETTLLPALQDAIDEIYALGAPRGEAGRAEAFLVAFQDAVDAGEQLRVPSLERLEGLLARPGKLAREDGLESCVYG